MALQLNQHGRLRPGLHQATLEETLCTFAYGGPERAALGCALSEIYDRAVRTGVHTMIVGGSFVTEKPAPLDLDCAVVQPNLPSPVVSERWPRANIQVDLKRCRTDDDLIMWIGFFQLDRSGTVGKGCVQLTLPADPDVARERADFIAAWVEKSMYQVQELEAGPYREEKGLLWELLRSRIPVDQAVTDYAQKKLAVPGGDPAALKGVELEKWSREIQHLVREKLRALPEEKRQRMYQTALEQTPSAVRFWTSALTPDPDGEGE